MTYRHSAGNIHGAWPVTRRSQNTAAISERSPGVREPGTIVVELAYCLLGGQYTSRVS